MALTSQPQKRKNQTTKIIHETQKKRALAITSTATNGYDTGKQAKLELQLLQLGAEIPRTIFTTFNTKLEHLQLD